MKYTKKDIDKILELESLIEWSKSKNIVKMVEIIRQQQWLVSRPKEFGCSPATYGELAYYVKQVEKETLPVMKKLKPLIGEGKNG